MGLFKFPGHFQAKKDRPTVVVFAGGMGAQIIQAAVYFSMKKSGNPVYADLSFFDMVAKMAAAGETGGPTFRNWELGQFGLDKASFDVSPGLNKRNANVLHDGTRMLELGLDALTQPDIQQIFKDENSISDILPEAASDGFLCIHVRRGDYVHSASHLIADNEFVSLARRFSGLVNHVVVLSDSPIEQDFRDQMSPHFKEMSFLDNIDTHTSHRIMRNARILICSNSTFSLTAALLNPNVLAVLPKQWYGGDHREMEVPIQNCCSFQIMG